MSGIAANRHHLPAAVARELPEILRSSAWHSPCTGQARRKRALMPNPPPSIQTHVPFHPCIRLEDLNKVRISYIDAEWEVLSLAPTRERALPMVPARARLATLPGLGPESHFDRQPALTPKPRRSRRPSFLASTLTAALTLGLALAAMVGWRNDGMFANHAPVPSFQSDPAAVAAELSAATPAELAPPPSAHVVATEAPAPANQLELPPSKPAPKSKRVPRAVLTTARVATEISTPRVMSASNFRSRQALASTDNPY